MTVVICTPECATQCRCRCSVVRPFDRYSEKEKADPPVQTDSLVDMHATFKVVVQVKVRTYN